MATAKFTKATVEKLIAAKADALTFDEASPGFGLRTYSTGAPAKWFVKYDAAGTTRRMVIGPASWANVDAMRHLAEVTRAKAKLGTDTLAEQRAARAQPKARELGDLVEPYLKARAAELRPRSLYISRMYLTKHWAVLHRRRLDDITRRDIVPLIDEAKDARGAVTADRMKTVLSSFYAWAIDANYADANPCSDIRNRAPSGSRERVLSMDELAAIWTAAGDDTPFGKVVRLLMLCGSRKAEIAGLRWPEINLAGRLLELPAERVKINKPFLVALSAPAVAILKTVPAVVDQAASPRDAGREALTGLFPAFSASRYMDDLRAALPDLAHWTLHDLRRSFSTHANEMGLAPPHVIESALGHLVGSKVSRAYNKALYLKERRALMDAWGDHIERIVGTKAGGKRRGRTHRAS